MTSVLKFFVIQSMVNEWNLLPQEPSGQVQVQWEIEATWRLQWYCDKNPDDGGDDQGCSGGERGAPTPHKYFWGERRSTKCSSTFSNYFGMPELMR